MCRHKMIHNPCCGRQCAHMLLCEVSMRGFKEARGLGGCRLLHLQMYDDGMIYMLPCESDKHEGSREVGGAQPLHLQTNNEWKIHPFWQTEGAHAGLPGKHVRLSRRGGGGGGSPPFTNRPCWNTGTQSAHKLLDEASMPFLNFAKGFLQLPPACKCMMMRRRNVRFLKKRGVGAAPNAAI